MARPRTISDAQIDDAARAAVCSEGPGVTVARIAERLGVSHAALLQRAGSKQALLRRALSPGVPEALERLAAAPPLERPGAWLTGLLDELLAFHEQMLPGLMMLRACGPAPHRFAGARLAPTVALRRLLARWLHRAGVAPPRRAAALAEALLGALEARCFNAFLGGPAFVEGDARTFVRRLVTELVPELQDPREATS